jgi:hypothetical protein
MTERPMALSLSLVLAEYSWSSRTIHCLPLAHLVKSDELLGSFRWDRLSQLVITWCVEREPVL